MFKILYLLLPMLLFGVRMADPKSANKKGFINHKSTIPSTKIIKKKYTHLKAIDKRVMPKLKQQVYNEPPKITASKIERKKIRLLDEIKPMPKLKKEVLEINQNPQLKLKLNPTIK